MSRRYCYVCQVEAPRAKRCKCGSAAFYRASRFRDDIGFASNSIHGERAEFVADLYRPIPREGEALFDPGPSVPVRGRAFFFGGGRVRVSGKRPQ